MRFNYWLSPDIKLHNAGDGIAVHNEWAKDYLIELNGEEWWHNFMLSDDYKYPYEVLHDMGWIRITIDSSKEKKVDIRGNGLDLTKPMRNTMSPAMNYGQMHLAKMICEDEGFDFYKAINDKMLW